MGCASSGPAVTQASSSKKVEKQHEYVPQPILPAPALKSSLTDASLGRRSSTSGTSNRVSFDANSKEKQRSRRQSVEVSHRKVVDVFYSKVIDSSAIGFYFDGADLLKIKRKMEKVIVLAFSDGEGLEEYNLAQIHKNMMKEKGFDMKHWETFVQLFEDTLRELQIPRDKITSVLDYLHGTRPVFVQAMDENVV